MCDEIPWDELFELEQEDTTENVITIMTDYCVHIEESSGKKVHARFVEMELAKRTVGGVASIAQVFAQEGEIYESNALSQRDINELYDSATYVFDIYNETYQFRLCELVYGALYPIEVSLDEGVEKEMRRDLRHAYSYDTQSGSYRIKNDEELRGCFAIMFRSKKTRNILRRLHKD